jgi:hypothetical protein
MDDNDHPTEEYEAQLALDQVTDWQLEELFLSETE